MERAWQTGERTRRLQEFDYMNSNMYGQKPYILLLWYQMKIEWNEERNQYLQKKRKISFEVVEELICDGSVIIEPHPNKIKYSNQILIIFRYESYWWVCPAIELEDGFFLKTIYPGRKVKRGMEDERSK